MKKVYILIIIIILGIAGAFVYFSMPSNNKYSTAQKEKVLSQTLGRKVNLEEKKATGNKNFSDKYVSFEYSGEAVEYKYRDPSFASASGTLSMFSYDIKSPRVVFNYVASSRPNIKTLDDDPSYRLRTMPERGYTKSMVSQESMGGLGAIKFTRNDPTNSERDIFLLKNEIEYSFIFTGPDSSALDEQVKLFAATFKFND